MVSAELWRTAVHESGHAVAAVLLRATMNAGPITINPGVSYSGICYFGRTRKPGASDLDDLTRPYPLLPARLRRFHEVRCMCLLAGEIAVDLHGGRDAPPPAEVDTETVGPVDSCPVLPPGDVETLELAAARDVSRSDVEQAMRAMLALHFDDLDLAHRHVGFLAAECESMMAGDRACKMVLALAAELMRWRTLPARRWKSVLAGVP